MTLRVWRRLFIVGLALVVVQVCVAQRFVFGGAHPDLFLLLAIAAGLVAGPQHGAVVAFVTGVVADLFVVTPFGLSALCYVLVAFAVGLLSASPGGRSPNLYRVVATFVASIGGTLLFMAITLLVGQPHLPRSQVVAVVAVVSVTNAILAVPAALAMQWAFAGANPSRDALMAGGSALR